MIVQEKWVWSSSACLSLSLFAITYFSFWQLNLNFSRAGRYETNSIASAGSSTYQNIIKNAFTASLTVQSCLRNDHGFVVIYQPSKCKYRVMGRLRRLLTRGFILQPGEGRWEIDLSAAVPRLLGPVWKRAQSEMEGLLPLCKRVFSFLFFLQLTGSESLTFPLLCPSWF